MIQQPNIYNKSKQSYPRVTTTLEQSVGELTPCRSVESYCRDVIAQRRSRHPRSSSVGSCRIFWWIISFALSVKGSPIELPSHFSSRLIDRRWAAKTASSYVGV